MILKSMIAVSITVWAGAAATAHPDGQLPEPQIREFPVLLLQRGQLITSGGGVEMQAGSGNVAALALAQHLKTIGAKMYGAFWCGFCKRQKQLFGSAVQQINYIECDPKGKNSKTRLCQQAGITSFPTWEINGKLYPGLRTLSELATLSGYKGQL